MPKEANTPAQDGLQPGALLLPQGLCALVCVLATFSQLWSSDGSRTPQKQLTKVPEEFPPLGAGGKAELSPQGWRFMGGSAPIQ